MTRNQRVTAKQRKLIRALLTASSIAEAAKTAKVSESTAHRWLKQALFKAELEAASKTAVDQVARRLGTLAVGASAVLGVALSDKELPMATRLSAVNMTLTHLPRLRELSALEERLTAIEETLTGGHDE